MIVPLELMFPLAVMAPSIVKVPFVDISPSAAIETPVEPKPPPMFTKVPLKFATPPTVSLSDMVTSSITFNSPNEPVEVELPLILPPTIKSSVTFISSVDVTCSAVIVPTAVMFPFVNIFPLADMFPLAVMCPVTSIPPASVSNFLTLL